MRTVDGTFIAIGFFAEILLVPLLLAFLARLKVDVGKVLRRRAVQLIALVVLVIIPIIMGISNGCSIKEGNYSEHTCYVQNCSNPASCKVKVFEISYYCSEHSDEAYEIYEYYTGLEKSSSSSKKCKSCERSYTDSTNKKYISHTNMCKNCYRNYCILSGKTPENYG